MVEAVDIQGLLRNGYWQSTRTRPTSPRFTSPTAATTYAYNDAIVPRTTGDLPLGTRILQTNLPPSPSVEDEADSLAREYGSIVKPAADEEPQNRGTIDQPVCIMDENDIKDEERDRQLQPKPNSKSNTKSNTKSTHKPKDEPELTQDNESGSGYDSNSERRFLLVSRPTDSSDESSTREKRVHRETKRSKSTSRSISRRPSRDPRKPYEANTGRKYDSFSEDDKFARKREGERRESKARDTDRHESHSRPDRERRRSRPGHLPPIVTDLPRHSGWDKHSRDLRTNRTAIGFEQEPEDYFSLRRSSYCPSGELLSPDVIKHSTKGRERAYFGVPTPSPESQSRPRSSQVDDARYGRSIPIRRRDKEGSWSYSTSPILPKRHSAYEVPRFSRRSSREVCSKSHNFDEPISTRSDRKVSPVQYRPPRPPMGPRSSSYSLRRESPTYEDIRYSSGEEAQRRNVSRRRRESARDERDGHLATPLEYTHASGRRSIGPSPLSSPRISKIDFFQEEPRHPTHSITWPQDPDKRHVSRTIPEELPSGRPLSRASTARSSLSNSGCLPVPITMTPAMVDSVVSDASSPIDRRRTPKPAAHARQFADSRSTSYSSISTPASSPPKADWHLPKLDPAQSTSRLNKPFATSRHASDDAISNSELPNLPDCPRTGEVAGHSDWLTVQGCTNLHICPSCYELTFKNSQFANLIVPMQLRHPERAVSCDFGSSQWYHLAWLLTIRYKLADLRLFRAVAQVEASGLLCTGSKPGYRIWYTVKNPFTQEPIQKFNVCPHCAKSIEVLLPVLSGVFVPMDLPAAQTEGICDMHQDSHGSYRKRFLAYFAIMEAVSDEAVELKRSPDLEALTDGIRELTCLPECPSGMLVNNARWHIMEWIPGFTACKECYEEVVQPELERDPSGVRGYFLDQTQKLPVGVCQLWPPEIKEAFRKAAQIGGNAGLLEFRDKVYEYWTRKEHSDRAKLPAPSIVGRQAVREPEWNDGARRWSVYRE